MNKTYHKFLILFSILILIVGVYFYFSNSLKSEASLTSSTSSLQSSLNSNGLSSSPNDKIASDIAFISTLASVSRINIDTTLFTNKSFQALNDNTVKLEVGVPGRINPFSPIGNNPLLNTIYPSQVITNKPLEIKNKTAVLSGTISSTTGVTDAYFKYGLTKNLDLKTPTATVSLIGVFISNITGLKSETNYFYKACSKINGATFCGDIISFNTNK